MRNMKAVLALAGLTLVACGDDLEPKDDGKTPSDSKVVHLDRIMIHNYYDTDFTLEECASRLHYNANYLSSVFKKEMNCTFTEYLGNYRINVAKTWLGETDMTVKEISEKLMYNNSQNFIRSFRKLVGMTPGEYRSKFSSDV